MIELARLLTEVCLAWLMITLAASWLSAAAYPLQRLAVRAYNPATRAFGALVYAMLAPVAAALVLVLLMQPQLSSALLPSHCHDQVCGPHAPDIEATSLLGSALVSIATLAVITLLFMLYRNLQWGRRRILALDAISERPAGDHTYRVVDSPALLAWCGGLWRPQIYLSRGLLSRLDGEQLQVVLAHERAHAARRDNLQRTVLFWATFFWPAALRTKIRRDFAGASEQVCDLAAVRQVGSVPPVESVIALLSGYSNQQPRTHGATFATPQHRDRLQALRNVADKRGMAAGSWLLIVLLWVTQVAVLTRVAHPVLEWVT